MEVATIIGLYGLYEIVRGQGHATLGVAREHTDGIVALERHLHLFGERTIQQAAHWVPGLPTLLGVAYIALHFLGTAAFLIWLPNYINQFGATLQTSSFAFLIRKLSAIQLAVFGLVLVVFLLVEPRGLARLWQRAKDYFRLWPFRY